MVAHFSSNEWQELRQRNKRCKRQQVLHHVSGRKPMEQIEDDMRVEIGDLSATIDHVNVWKKAYIRPDGSAATPQAIEIMNGIILDTLQSDNVNSPKFNEGEQSRSKVGKEESNMNSDLNRLSASKQIDTRKDDTVSPRQLLDMYNKVIAKGVIVGRDSKYMLNNESLKEGFLAVSVEVVKNPRTPLIVQAKDMTTLKEAKEEVIAWPSRYVKEVMDGSPKVPSSSSNKECILKDGQCNTVAIGRILSNNPTSLVHHELLGDDTYKVKLEVIVISSNELFYKTSFATTLADVGVNGITYWPRKYTILI